MTLPFVPSALRLCDLRKRTFTSQKLEFSPQIWICFSIFLMLLRIQPKNSCNVCVGGVLIQVMDSLSKSFTCRHPHPNVLPGFHHRGPSLRQQGRLCLLWHRNDQPACQGERHKSPTTVFASFVLSDESSGKPGSDISWCLHWEECASVSDAHPLRPRWLHAVLYLQHHQPWLYPAELRCFGEGHHLVYSEGSRFFGPGKVQQNGIFCPSMFFCCTRIFLVDGEVEEQASINRNPISYNANPEEERAR